MFPNSNFGRARERTELALKYFLQWGQGWMGDRRRRGVAIEIRTRHSIWVFISDMAFQSSKIFCDIFFAETAFEFERRKIRRWWWRFLLFLSFTVVLPLIITIFAFFSFFLLFFFLVLLASSFMAPEAFAAVKLLSTLLAHVWVLSCHVAFQSFLTFAFRCALHAYKVSDFSASLCSASSNLACSLLWIAALHSSR